MKPAHVPVTLPFPTESLRSSEPVPPHRPRYEEGWRAGKPVEDPAKTKTWGWITAKPSEYLVHVRRGQVLRSSGQGASCFKLPWDSVAIIPTTISRLQFTADQVTREKVGVQVTGLAVFRITDPEMTFKMLNFSFAERASEKLELILKEMFMGSVRRIVAGMSVEEVITQRKERLAEEILREIAPIVSGRGRETDKTRSGWGVVIDTIEIQDVRILSEAVFKNMQAIFRAELDLKARTAALQSAKEIAEKETQNAKEIAEARIAAEAGTRELKAKADSHAAEIELAEGMKREKMRAASERAKIAEAEAIEQALAEKSRKVEAVQAAAAREKAEALAELESWKAQAKIELERSETEAKLARQKLESEAWRESRERELTVERQAGEVANANAMGQRQVENFVSEDAIRRDLVLEALPKLAEAFAQNFGEMRFLQIGDGSGEKGGDPLAFITKAFAQVLAVAQSAGIKLPGQPGNPPVPPASGG